MFFRDQLGWVGRCQLGAFVISGSEWAGEKTAGVSGLDYRYFLLCFRPLPPTSWGGRWKERGGGDAEGPRRCSRILSAPHCPPSTSLRPFGHGWGGLPGALTFQEAVERLKGSLMCLGHGGKPQSLARPRSKPQLLSPSFSPPPPSPALQPGGKSHTRAATFFF